MGFAALRQTRGEGMAGSRRGFDIGSRHHIITMARTHPHAEATYTVVPFEDGTFGVQVAIPETYPTTVRPFPSEAEAEAWIAKHKIQVEAGATSGQWFRKTGGGRRG
jgi:hypothetical protein